MVFNTLFQNKFGYLQKRNLPSKPSLTKTDILNFQYLALGFRQTACFNITIPYSCSTVNSATFWKQTIDSDTVTQKKRMYC